jgi:hypothetical protein
MSDCGCLPLGSIIFDLGQNIAGVAELRLLPDTPVGTVVTLGYGEVLDPATQHVAITFGQTDSYTYGSTNRTQVSDVLSDRSFELLFCQSRK